MLKTLLFVLHGAYGLHMKMTSTPVSPSISRQVLIVGGGIGGISTAFDARHILRPTDEVTVVSDRSSFQFTPSNPWVAVRMRTPNEISLPLNEVLPRHNIRFVHGKATHLDPLAQSLQLEDGQTLAFDYLVIATGPRLAFDEIPGSGPLGYSSSVCTTPHATETANAIDELCSNPGPIVVGATQVGLFDN